jgi:hypothetical protein
VTRRAALFGALLSLASGAAQAADSPPIRAFPLTTTERLGQAIARQDAAAWVATDALVARVGDPNAAHVKGWIVEDRPGGQRVRFLRDVGQGLEAGYDIDVAPDLKTAISEPRDRSLTPEEKANFAASNTAAAAMKGQPVCRPGYNHVVLKDPEGDGWLVWLLAPMPAAGAIPVGGHYRFTISADGKTIVRRDALSASCLVLPKPDPAAGNPAAAFVTHVVSPTPVETHVFLQIQSHQTLIVAAGDHAWAVLDGHIQDMGLLKDLAQKK